MTDSSRLRRVLTLAAFAVTACWGQTATLSVGPGQPYSAPCKAFAAAPAGALIQIDASGSYQGDVCAITASNLTIRGVNGRARIDAAGQNAQGKATWVIQGSNTTVENIEFMGAAVTDRNGAGIRQEGTNLTVRNCYFHDNQEGILTTSNPNSRILIEYSEFANNGYGDGQSHNMYINNVASFTLQYSYSHDAKVGHLVKSRAAVNYILYNRLSGENGTDSYELDLPNGGQSFVIGNVIEQGPNTGNSTLFAYMEEGATSGNPSHDLFVVNNTFVNDGPGGTFVNIASADSTPAVIRNNIFYGPGKITSQGSALQAANLTSAPLFVSASSYDYHLAVGSPAIDAGVAAGTGDAVSLTPIYEYVHPACGEGRGMAGSAIDIGAFEYGGAGAPLACGSTSAPPPPAAAALQSVALGAASVTGGKPLTGTVTLTAAAPAGGAAIALASSSAAAPVPANITIPAGATSASFTVQTAAVTATASATISASYGGTTRTAALAVVPATAAAPVLASLTCSPVSLRSGTVATCTVTLSGAAASATSVRLSDNSRILSVPSSATVAAGAASTAFTAKAGTVRWNQTATITASLARTSKTARISLTR